MKYQALHNSDKDLRVKLAENGGFWSISWVGAFSSLNWTNEVVQTRALFSEQIWFDIQENVAFHFSKCEANLVQRFSKSGFGQNESDESVRWPSSGGGRGGGEGRERRRIWSSGRLRMPELVAAPHKAPVRDQPEGRVAEASSALLKYFSRQKVLQHDTAKGMTVSQRIRDCGQYPPIGQCIITFSRISSCVSLVMIGPKRTSQWDEDCSAHKGSLPDPSRGLPTLSAHIFAGFYLLLSGHDLCHMTPKKGVEELQLEAREREGGSDLLEDTASFWWITSSLFLRILLYNPCWRNYQADWFTSDASHPHCFVASCSHCLGGPTVNLYGATSSLIKNSTLNGTLIEIMIKFDKNFPASPAVKGALCGTFFL